MILYYNNSNYIKIVLKKINLILIKIYSFIALIYNKNKIIYIYIYIYIKDF